MDNDEQLRLLEHDVALLEDLADWIRALEYEIGARGRSGEVEREKIKALAPRTLKAIVNYI